MLLDDLQPAVVALSETELGVSDVAVFKNYKVFYPVPVPNRGYRLLLLVRENLAANPTVIRSSHIEIWVRLEAPCGVVVVGSIYRQWSVPLEEEEDLIKLGESISVLSAKYERLVIIGDMNLNLAKLNDASYYRRRLLRLHMENISSNGFHIANELDMSPTYYSHGIFEDKKEGSFGQRSGILDHIYYRGFPHPTFTVLPYAITDHRPILSIFNLEQQSSSLKVIYRRNFEDINTTAISWAVNAEALSKIFAMDDVDEIHEAIIHEISAALDIVAPLRRVQVKERRTPLYLSFETRMAIRERDCAATSGNHDAYRRLRNRAARMVRRDKLASNVEMLQKEDFNPKAIWQLANAASGRSSRSNLPPELVDKDGKRVRGDADLADCMNQFYVTKIKRIRDGIGRDECSDSEEDREVEEQVQQQAQRQQQFRFRPPSESEVLAIIMGLNNTKALGVDGIPVAVLKHLAPIIAAPVAYLIKKSFELSVVPRGFKRASIIPLHKKSKPADLPSSYRPVSILPALSKVLERVVLRQVSRHLAPLLPPTQFGFRPRRGTTGAIAYSHGCWAAARARGLVVAVAGYDLSSAFDTIDVNMVCAKLRAFGVMGGENLWFNHYLSGRQQQVNYNSSRSTFRAVRYGVPQGSILGPLLFLALVADLPGELLALSAPHRNNDDVEIGVSTYADDTLCWAAGRSPDRVRAVLEELSATVTSYASKNFLALNESKTQVIWFPSRDSTIKVGSSVIVPSDVVEVLGVTFDKQLSPAPHLNSLISSAKAMAAVARRLRLHLPLNFLKSVMGSLMRGKIGYACAVFPPRLKSSDPTPTLMAQLQVGLNNVARAILGSKCEKIRVEDLVEEAGLFSLNRVLIYSIAMECWRALSLTDVPHGPLNPLGKILSPTQISSPSSSPRPAPRTRAAATGCLPPPAKHQVPSFIWSAYSCWNASPALRAASNMSAAKRAAIELANLAPF